MPTQPETKTILVVEDEPLTAKTERMQLEKYGYVVRTVTTGEQAVEAVQTASDIDLILMDIDLGDGMDGTQAAEIILKDHDIPIVFLSSHTEPEIVQRTEKITSYGYVVKSSSATVLDASIKMAFKLFDAQNRISQSEEKYRTLFETMSPGVVYHDVHGSIISANPASEKLLGLSFDQMKGKTSMDPRWKMITEDDEEVPGSEHPAMIALKTGKKVGPITRGIFVPETGEYIWILVSAIPLFRPGEDKPYQVYASFDDISEQRRAEVAMREQRDFSESLIETAQAIILVLDTQGCIVRFNPYMQDLLGYSLDEVKGMNWIETFVQPEDTHTVKTILRKTINDNQTSGHVNPIIAKDGQTILVEWSNKTLKDEDGYAIGTLVTGIDITERQRLQRSTELQSKLLQDIGQAAIATDLQGTVIYWNQMAETVYGWSSKDATGKNILDLTPTQQTQKQAADIMRKLVQGEKWSGEFTVQRKDGSSFPAHVTNSPIFNNEGNLIGIIGISTDITERKRFEQELIQKQQYLEKILETTSDGFWVVTPDRKISDVNAAYCRMSGYSKDELTRMEINDLEAIEDPQKTAERMKRIIENGSEVFETKHRRKDGSLLDIEASVSRLDQSDEMYFVTFCRDITERKQAEKQIRKQLAEKETLLREVHHRVKNNIAHIENLLSLQAGSTANARVKSELQDAISRVQSMRVLYDKLLLNKDLREISIKNYAEGLIDSIVIFLDPQHKIAVHKQLVDFTITAENSVSVGIIINELVTNVFKYAFGDRDKGMVSISLEKDENRVTLTIQDNGVGIDESAAENKSPGFGLTIVKMLVEQFDGTYSVVNDHGSKSVVQLEL